MKKYPKKPKASASLDTKKKYLAKVKDIDSENKARHKENVESEKLSKQIAGIGSATSTRSVRVSAPKKRKSVAKTSKRKAAKKTTKRRKR